VHWVAARTKLPVDRVAALERERETLAPDGQGRALARSLALAIGADPLEAAGRLGSTRRACSPRRPGPPVRRIDDLRIAALLALLLGGWLGIEWCLVRAERAPVPRVERTNYLGALLGEREAGAAGVAVP
jgi:hypothetical protein